MITGLSQAIMALLATGILNANLDYTESDLSTALHSIREAEHAGADVTNLTSKFNEALSLTNSGNFNGPCASNMNCIHADKMLKEISTEAQELKQQAENRHHSQVMLNYLGYSPLASIAGASAAVFGYRFYESYKEKRFMELEVRLKDEKPL